MIHVRDRMNRPLVPWGARQDTASDSRDQIVVITSSVLPTILNRLLLDGSCSRRHPTSISISSIIAGKTVNIAVLLQWPGNVWRLLSEPTDTATVQARVAIAAVRLDIAGPILAFKGFDTFVTIDALAAR